MDYNQFAFYNRGYFYFFISDQPNLLMGEQRSIRLIHSTNSWYWSSHKNECLIQQWMNRHLNFKWIPRALNWCMECYIRHECNTLKYCLNTSKFVPLSNRGKCIWSSNPKRYNLLCTSVRGHKGQTMNIEFLILSNCLFITLLCRTLR